MGILALYSSADQAQSHSEDSDSKQVDDTQERSPIARWQQDQLVVTTQTRRGSTTRTYELSRLSQPVVIRFVYDPIKSSE